VKVLPKNWVTAYVLPEVISPAEEQALLQFACPWFERLPYNDGHVDGLIHHYKEFYRSYRDLMAMAAGSSADGSCTPAGDLAADLPLVQAALARTQKIAQDYLPRITLDDRVHFLRLSGSGFIRSHVDENRNSSGIIAGLCLNAARVMTLTHPEHPGEEVELLLAPRCLYIMIGHARYTWEHSVDWVKDDDEHVRRVQQSLLVEGTPITFDGAPTPYSRFDRTAVIFRGISPMHLLAQRMQRQRQT